MAKYSLEFKEKVVRRLMPPNAESVVQVHRDARVLVALLFLAGEISAVSGGLCSGLRTRCRPMAAEPVNFAFTRQSSAVVESNRYVDWT